MTAFIARHGLFAIGLIVLLEEAGIPLLVPADLLILLAGARSAHSVAQLGQRHNRLRALAGRRAVRAAPSSCS